MRLQIENIEYSIGNVFFRYNVDMVSQITGVFGHSGAGKTTLMNIISGIEMPYKGRLVFNDKEFYDKQKRINQPVNKRNIGIVFQDNYLFPHKTVKQNLLYSKPYIKKKRRFIEFEKVLELLDIEHLLKKKPFELSGGERQRVAIGRTLLSQPEMLLLDEPFSNLDKKRRIQIISYLLRINNQYGIPLMIISHDLEDILKLTSSLLIIDKGRIIASGNYLNIVDSGHAKGILSYKRYINIIDVFHLNYNEKEKLNTFSIDEKDHKPFVKTNSQYFNDKKNRGKKVRLCIYPDDIALNGEPLKNTSIQNQIKGKISTIRYVNDSCYVSVDCGIILIAEITGSAVQKMQIKSGKTVYCMIKAKAIEVVHIYKNRRSSSVDDL